MLGGLSWRSGLFSLSAMELIPHSLTPLKRVYGIRSLFGVSSLVGPFAQLVLYLRYSLTEG